jgi:CMP-N,N'-diacetyllegionaminic acid synthase
MKILCIIPARSGSKGIENKNIKTLGGKPLMAWSIEQAKECKYMMRIIVSTDNTDYAEIARMYGAETPFIRPIEISQDLSTDYEFMEHSLGELKKENYEPDFIVQLRPTYPTRKVELLNETIKLFIENRSEYDSLRTIIPFDKSPFKMYTIEDNCLNPLFRQLGDMEEPYNQCRQNLPKTYLHNGYIDIVNTNIIKNGKISGNKILPFLMSGSEYHDIDYAEDFKKVEDILISAKKKCL